VNSKEEIPKQNRGRANRVVRPAGEISVPGVTGGIRARTWNGIEPGCVGNQVSSSGDGGRAGAVSSSAAAPRVEQRGEVRGRRRVLEAVRPSWSIEPAFMGLQDVKKRTVYICRWTQQNQAHHAAHFLLPYLFFSFCFLLSLSLAVLHVDMTGGAQLIQVS
jgi:hypothetical protein